jgi:DNA-binding CsgD family transcriptional regulator/tetratricopeptide (TPR) repeat protein
VTRANLARRFIGRDEEIERLEALLVLASGGETRFALVSGAAGVGKSSLIAEFARRADAHVLMGTCLPLGEHGVPFAPIVEMLRRLESDSRSVGLLPTGLGSLAPASTTETSEPSSRTNQFQAVLDLITRLADSTTTVLVIEDLHWADRSTRDLLSYLIPNLRTDRLLVVMSYRTDDIHRDHPLRPVLAELLRNPWVDHLDVPPFSAPLVAEQIEHLTGRAPSSSALADVMSRTQGNPYFVEQLVAADCLDGRALPASLRELLLVRADVVSPPARRTLRILSLAEDQVNDESLARVAATSVRDVRDHIREALDTRLLIRSPTGTQFAHALLREALQEDLLPGERTEYHAAFAAVLASELDDEPGNRAGLLARLAHHREGAGDVAGALEAWSRAASAAEAIFAFAEAHHHLARIIAHWGRAPTSPERSGAEYADVVARAAEDAFLGGDPAVASELVREAIALVDESTEPRTAGVLYERLARYVRDTEEHDRALELVQRALELVPEDPPSADRARVLAAVAGHLMTNGRYAEARGLATRAIDTARRVGSTLAEADALNTMGVLRSVTDDIDHSIETLHEALMLAERCGDAHQQMRSYWNTFACLSDAGEWERALTAFRNATAQLPRLGQGHLLPELFGNAADILMRLGRWDEAQLTIDEAHQQFATGGSGAALAELLVERGQFDEARRLIESKTARNVFLDQEQQGWPLVNLAALETWEGHYEAARRAVDAALEVIADVDGPIAPSYAVAVGCRCEADVAEQARRDNADDEADLANTRAEAFVKQIKDLMARPGPVGGWKREVGALALLCEAELSRAGGASVPDAWAAATNAWDRLSMPYQAAYTQFRNGEAVFSATGDRGQTGVLLAGAHRVAASLGAHPLRMLIETFARRARVDIGLPSIDRDAHGLTPRERDVLACLSTGATNRQIAATLFISEKTASLHVSNIMRKLGVSNRGQAAALAHREGLLV